MPRLKKEGPVCAVARGAGTGPETVLRHTPRIPVLRVSFSLSLSLSPYLFISHVLEEVRSSGVAGD